MNDDMTPGRRLLAELVDVPGLFDGLRSEDDLLSAGINSGELIKLALAIEERTGTALDDDELATLYTIEGIDRVLAEHAGTAEQADAAEHARAAEHAGTAASAASAAPAGAGGDGGAVREEVNR